jgi:glycolate oxidase
LELGGTLSGEHGIGFMKAPYVLQELGRDGYLAQKAVKDALDPVGFLNPDKIFVEKELELGNE